MARPRRSEGPGPLVWPQAGLAADAAPMPAPVPRADWIEAAAFAGVAGPEITRLLGFRLSLRPVAAPPAAAGPETLIALAEAATPAGQLCVGLDRRTVGLVLDRMFGAREPGSPGASDRLSGLAPACGSWLALAGLVAQALGQPLRECGLAGPARPRPAGRIAPMGHAAAADCQWFAVDLAGDGGWLAITRSRVVPATLAEPAEAEPLADSELHEARPLAAEVNPRAASSARPGSGPASGADRGGWPARASALAQAIELPVGVRIAEIRLPLDQAMRLTVGQILPIDRPRLLMLSVDGVPWRQLPGLPAPDLGGAQP